MNNGSVGATGRGGNQAFVMKYTSSGLRPLTRERQDKSELLVMVIIDGSFFIVSNSSCCVTYILPPSQNGC